jgi:hypothetical protein
LGLSPKRRGPDFAVAWAPTFLLISFSCAASGFTLQNSSCG